MPLVSLRVWVYLFLRSVVIWLDWETLSKYRDNRQAKVGTFTHSQAHIIDEDKYANRRAHRYTDRSTDTQTDTCVHTHTHRGRERSTSSHQHTSRLFLLFYTCPPPDSRDSRPTSLRVSSQQCGTDPCPSWSYP